MLPIEIHAKPELIYRVSQKRNMNSCHQQTIRSLLEKSNTVKQASGPMKTNRNFHTVLSALQTYDHSFSKYIQKLHFHRLIEMILLIPGLIFGRHLFPYVIISSFIFFGQEFGFHLTISSLFTVLVTEGLKHVINRDRPSLYDTTNKLVQMRKYMSNPAFPSGDSAQAAVFTGVLFTHGHANILFLLIPFPTMFSRVYYGVHWVGDTIAGLFIGLLFSTLIVPLFDSLLFSIIHIHMFQE